MIDSVEVCKQVLEFPSPYICTVGPGSEDLKRWSFGEEG